MTVEGRRKKRRKREDDKKEEDEEAETHESGLVSGSARSMGILSLR